MALTCYPTIEQVIAALGKHTQSAEVIALMDRLQITEKDLRLRADLEDWKIWTDGDCEIQLEFEDIGRFIDIPYHSSGEGPWLLTDVIFWSDVNKGCKQSYAGPLPDGLDFSMTRNEIHALLPEAELKNTERVDAWKKGDHKLVINYDSSNQKARCFSLKADQSLSEANAAALADQLKPSSSGIDIQRYIPLLGCDSNDANVEKMFEELTVKRRPALSSPPRSPYEAILPVKPLGILLAFSEKNYYNRSAKRSHGKSRSLVFNNIAISAGIPDHMRCYEGCMPFGIEWTDTRKIVREKMAALGYADRLHAHTRDAWWLDESIVRMSYASENVRLPMRAVVNEISIGVNKTVLAELPAAYYPSLEQLRNLLGKSANSAEFYAAFQHFEPEKLIADIPLGVKCGLNTVNRSMEYGFVICIDPDRPAPDGSPSITGFEMQREGLGASHPWLGELPYSLDFDDSPAVLPTKLGRKANQWQEFEVWGIGRWYFDHEFVRVQFDNLNNCLESVSIFISGYRNRSA